MMQQFLEPTPNNTDNNINIVKIIIDHRECSELDEILKRFGASVDRCALPVGDFLCSARLVVERKTRSDFEQSIVDGRLFSQIPQLLYNYQRVVVIVEGTSDASRLSREALLGAYASLLSDYGISLIFTRDLEHTAEVIYNFAKHEQLAKKQPLRLYAKRKTFTPSQTARAIVEMLPTVGPKMAKKLLSHFGSVEKIFEASERELLEVDGLGKKKAKLIRATISYKYDEDEDSSAY